MKTLIATISFLFVLNLQFASAGETKIWEDEEGVTHIEIKGSSTRKTNYNKQRKLKNYNPYKRPPPVKKYAPDYERERRLLKLELEREKV